MIAPALDVAWANTTPVDRFRATIAGSPSNSSSAPPTVRSASADR